MRMAVSMVLKSQGYDVTTANGGRDALEKMRKSSRFNLIITDLNPPNMDGLSLIKEAKKMGFTCFFRNAQTLIIVDYRLNHHD